MDELPSASDKEKTPGARRVLFWLIPALAGCGLLGWGIWVVRGWNDLEVFGKLAGVGLMVLGGGILVVLTALLLILWLMRRLFRGLKRDVKSLAYSAKYMLRQGRMRD